MDRKNSARTLMLADVLALLGPGGAWADANPANDSGQFTVRITPNVDLGVTVDTVGASWSGSVDLDVTAALSAEVMMDVGVLVTVAGNLNRQELQLTGAALNTWTLDTDETPTVDQLRLYAMFSDPTAMTLVNTDFDGAANLITTVPRRTGQPQADEDAASDLNHVYELSNSNPEYMDIDDMLVTTERTLWMRANTPPASSTAQQQSFMVTVTAVTGTGL